MKELKEDYSPQKEHSEKYSHDTSISKKAETLLNEVERLHNKGKFQDSTQCAEKCLQLYKRLGDNEGVLKIRQFIAANYIIERRVEKAETYLNEFLVETIALFGEKHEWTAIVYNQLGYLYNVVLRDLEQGIPYSKKCLEIRLGLLGENDPQMAFAYHNMGYCYGQLRDFDKQILYYQKALNIRLNVFGELHDDTALSYNNIGYYYSTAQNDYQTAIDYHQKALFIRQKVCGEQHNFTAMSYSQLGACYKNFGMSKEALSNYSKALSIYQQTFGKQHPEVALIHEAFGNIYLSINNSNKAIQCYKQAIDIYELNYKTRHSQKSKLKHSWAEALLIQEQYLLALYKLEESLEELLKAEKKVNQHIWEIYSLEDFVEESQLMVVFRLKAHLLFLCFQHVSPEPNYLKACFDYYHLAVQFIDKRRKSYQTQGSQLFLGKEVTTIYANGLKTSIDSQTHSLIVPSLDLAFLFSEKAKGAVFLQNQQNTKAKAIAKIPQILLHQEKELKIKLAFFEKSIQKETVKKGKGNKKLIQKWQSEYFNFHEQYTQLLQELETDYPDYYQLKYDTKTVTPTELQSTLSKNQIFISYFIGEKSIYIFVITPDEFEVEELEKPDDFEGMIQAFLKSIHAHDKADYLQLAYELYELLIAPVELHWYDGMSDFLEQEDSAKSQQQIILIPHAELSYLPFEALISESADEEDAYQELNYLVQNYEISYHYSATLWQYGQQKKGERAETEHSFVGFAPVYEEERGSERSEVGSEGVLKLAAKEMSQWATRSEALRSDGTWTPLPHSKEEAENIAALFEGKGLSSETYLHEEATKERFQEAVGKARYLLVAAHGVVNDEKTALSGLVFYPNSVEPLSRSATVDKVLTREVETLSTAESLDNSWNDGKSSKTDCILSMEETYPLNINADLVVLSSCESGIGKLHKGEGMMAVNRGFLAAGAKNVISTLFKVYDKPSSLLTQYLFEAILEGEDYISALRKAKLRLLERENVSPKSWCGFVLIGA